MAKPSFYQLTEKSKWNAWKELAGMGRAEAMNQYVEKVVKHSSSFSRKMVLKHKRDPMKVGELQPSWRDEVVVEPTEGWVSVSSPVREKESEEVKQT